MFLAMLAVDFLRFFGKWAEGYRLGPYPGAMGYAADLLGMACILATFLSLLWLLNEFSRLASGTASWPGFWLPLLILLALGGSFFGSFLLFHYVIGNPFELGRKKFEAETDLVALAQSTILIREFIGQLEGAASLEANQKLGRKTLEWQTGYGVVSFGTRDLKWVGDYIRNQRDRHARGAVEERLERITDDEAEAEPREAP